MATLVPSELRFSPGLAIPVDVWIRIGLKQAADWYLARPARWAVAGEREQAGARAADADRAAVGATITQYGGRFLTRGGATELIEGGPPKRIVIVEFADAAAVKRWYNSPEYQKILPGRLDNSTSRAFIVEGAS
jgi:uncharacterized protein (DUF1330 family)